MVAFFEHLFGGEIYPAEEFITDVDEHRQLQHKLFEASEALWTILTDE